MYFLLFSLLYIADCSTVAVQLPWSFCHWSVTVSAARHTCRRPMVWDVDVPPAWRVDSRPTDTVKWRRAETCTPAPPVWSRFCLVGSQCSCRSTGVMWSRRRAPVTSRAVAFCRCHVRPSVRVCGCTVAYLLFRIWLGLGGGHGEREERESITGVRDSGSGPEPPAARSRVRGLRGLSGPWSWNTFLLDV